MTEFVEIARTEEIGDLDDYRIVFYDGETGTEYKELVLRELAPFEENTDNGITFAAFSAWDLGNPFQDGPDGLALVSLEGGTDTVVQFLSYGASFTALDGPAAGEISMDVGVEEPQDVTSDQSLQLGGSGLLYNDFVWQDHDTSTPGSANVDQTIVACTGGAGGGGNQELSIGAMNRPADEELDMFQLTAIAWLYLLHNVGVLDVQFP